MTQTGGASARYPAPGSPVPGAPPPLKRALTPADGVVPATGDAADPTAGARRIARSQMGEGGAAKAAPRWTAAAAMVGVAAGLELAGLLARRSKGVKC